MLPLAFFMSKSVRPVSASWRDVPRSIPALGIVSLLMDISSELIHSLLPVFLVTVLGASTATVGLIEGVGEATAAIGKVFSGALSDRIGKRKLLTVIGYGLSALTKPVFPLASTGWQVLGARFVDRIGKGIRDAPRDALIADITPPAVRVAGYGIRQALDTAGGVGGPLLAMALMTLYADNFRAVFWWSVVPAVLAVLVLVVAVQEPPGTKKAKARGWPIRKQELKRLPAAYLIAVAIGVVFTLARLSEAFLSSRRRRKGWRLRSSLLSMSG